MKLSSKTEAAVLSVLRRFSEAYNARDADLTASLFLPGEESVLIDSGERELAIGSSQIRSVLQKEFSRHHPLNFEVQWGSIWGNDNIAWVATAGKAIDSSQRTETGRFTAVLEQRNQQWFLVQAHFSFPARFGADRKSLSNFKGPAVAPHAKENCP